MLFSTNFDASIALLTFFRLMRTVPSPHTSIKTDLIDISYRGTGTGIEFKHVVYFAKNATYIYRYQAPHDLYKEHIDVISKYLESLTIHYE